MKKIKSFFFFFRFSLRRSLQHQLQRALLIPFQGNTIHEQLLDLNSGIFIFFRFLPTSLPLLTHFPLSSEEKTPETLETPDYNQTTTQEPTPEPTLEQPTPESTLELILELTLDYKEVLVPEILGSTLELILESTHEGIRGSTLVVILGGGWGGWGGWGAWGGWVWGWGVGILSSRIC